MKLCALICFLFLSIEFVYSQSIGNKLFNVRFRVLNHNDFFFEREKDLEKIHVWYEKGKPVYLHMFSKFKQVEFYDLNFEADAYIFKRKYSTLNLEIPSFDLQTSDRIIMDTVNVMRETTA